MRNWLVTGAGGMLGQDVLVRLAADGIPAVAATRTDLDITDPASVRAALAAHRPAVVVNCATWTAVDDAESREDEALRINGDGPGHLASDCADTGTVLLHVSTGYVFSSDATTPYAEDAPTAPRSAYGRTKLAGERAVLKTLPDHGYVVRTAWLYGAGGPNFVRTMIRLADERDTLDVDDQRGQPTWSADLAGLLYDLGRGALSGTAPVGVYHGTSFGETTWYGFRDGVVRQRISAHSVLDPQTATAGARSTRASGTCTCASSPAAGARRPGSTRCAPRTWRPAGRPCLPVILPVWSCPSGPAVLDRRSGQPLPRRRPAHRQAGGRGGGSGGPDGGLDRRCDVRLPLPLHIAVDGGEPLRLRFERKNVGKYPADAVSDGAVLTARLPLEQLTGRRWAVRIEVPSADRGEPRWTRLPVDVVVTKDGTARVIDRHTAPAKKSTRKKPAPLRPLLRRAADRLRRALCSQQKKR